MANGKEGTALGAARARFIDGLPRKAQELKASLALLAGTPEAQKPRDEMRRRLHALYASAQVFRIDGLVPAIKDAITRIDEAGAEGRGLGGEDLDALAQLAGVLPALAADEPDSDSLKPVGASQAPGVEAPPSAPLPSAPPVRDGTLPSPPQGPNRFSTAEGFPPPASASKPPVRSSVPPAPFHSVVSVLVVDEDDVVAGLQGRLPVERFELFGQGDPEKALQAARVGAPDLVLIERDLAVDGDLDFVARLRSDPLTDFVPVVLIHEEDDEVADEVLQARGIDASLPKNAPQKEITALVAQLTGLTREGVFEQGIGEATVEEVADRLAEELRRGLVEAADGKDVKVPLGAGSELLAAAWSTIAKVRAQVAERSGGEVRFRDQARPGDASVVTVGDEEVSGEDDGISLEGRRIVVADDDPAVVWFFAGLLREEGATVVEVEDGEEALAAARKQRPDVIVSDILMPAMDGLSLCREIQRDPALSDIPVILLSWKEDFIQRMRELRSGASGYLRKEAGSGQILAKIREVLRPRTRLQRQLEDAEEVRGRIEGVGVQTLLRDVGAEWKDARVTLRDAANLFEVDLRGGELIDVTRTASDGSFARGERALAPLVGVSAGRFSATRAETPVRGSLSGEVGEALEEAVHRLGACVDAVSGTKLSKVAELDFDEELLGAARRTSTAQSREVINALAAGKRPAELFVLGKVGPQELEATLVDLARHGAIAGVRDADGNDLIAEALAERRRQQPSQAPEEATPLESFLEVVEEKRASLRASQASSKPVTSAPPPPPPEPEVAAAGVPVAEEDDDADELEALSSLISSKPPAPRISEPPEPEEEDVDSDEENQSLFDFPEAPGDEDDEEPEGEAPEAEPSDEEDKASSGPGLLAWVAVAAACAAVGFLGWRMLHNDPDAGLTGEEVPVSETENPDAETPETENVEAQNGASENGASGNGSAENPVPENPAPEHVAEPTPEASPETEVPEAAPEAVANSPFSHGQNVPRILERGIEVGEGEGLLWVEAPGDAATTRVAVGLTSTQQRTALGEAPIGAALPAGEYELIYRRGADETFRYVSIRAGQTRLVNPE